MGDPVLVLLIIGAAIVMGHASIGLLRSLAKLHRLHLQRRSSFDLWLKLELADGTHIWILSEVYPSEAEALRACHKAMNAGFIGGVVLPHGTLPEV